MSKKQCKFCLQARGNIVKIFAASILANFVVRKFYGLSTKNFDEIFYGPALFTILCSTIIILFKKVSAKN